MTVWHMQLKAMWYCAHEGGRGCWLCNSPPSTWDLSWSNLAFRWWVSWGAPNVPHFLTSYKRAELQSTTSEDTGKYHKTSIKRHVGVFVYTITGLTFTWAEPLWRKLICVALHFVVFIRRKILCKLVFDKITIQTAYSGLYFLPSELCVCKGEI